MIADLKFDESLERDLAAIAAMPEVPAMLQAVLRTTHMRFAAVARVTAERWTACAVCDLIEFGLSAGQDLKLETTICNEIRMHHQTVAFGHASVDPVFSNHPTPKLYRFESYLSVPVVRTDGAFFGTICALDPLPALLDVTMIRTVESFAEVLGRRLPTERARDERS